MFETYCVSMKGENLIGYCSEHAQTERAYFSREIIAQMIEYAGRPENYPSPEEVLKDFPKFTPLHEEMDVLVDLATKNLEDILKECNEVQ